jgi:hypothetical protein
MCWLMNRIRSQKPLLETGKTGHSGLANRMVQFCQFWWQSGAPPVLDDKLLLRSSGIWLKNRQEPRQSKGLWRRLLDLIKGKNKKQKTRVKVNCIDFDCWLHQSVTTYVCICSMMKDCMEFLKWLHKKGIPFREGWTNKSL